MMSKKTSPLPNQTPIMIPKDKKTPQPPTTFLVRSFEKESKSPRSSFFSANHRAQRNINSPKENNNNNIQTDQKKPNIAPFFTLRPQREIKREHIFFPYEEGSGHLGSSISSDTNRSSEASVELLGADQQSNTLPQRPNESFVQSSISKIRQPLSASPLSSSNDDLGQTGLPPLSKMDELGNTLPKMSDSLHNTDDFGNSLSNTDEFGNALPQTDEFGNALSKTDEFGNALSKADEFGNAISNTKELSHAQITPKINSTAQKKLPPSKLNREKRTTFGVESDEFTYFAKPPPIEKKIIEPKKVPHTQVGNRTTFGTLELSSMLPQPSIQSETETKQQDNSPPPLQTKSTFGNLQEGLLPPPSTDTLKAPHKTSQCDSCTAEYVSIASPAPKINIPKLSASAQGSSSAPLIEGNNPVPASKRWSPREPRVKSSHENQPTNETKFSSLRDTKWTKVSQAHSSNLPPTTTQFGSARQGINSPEQGRIPPLKQQDPTEKPPPVPYLPPEIIAREKERRLQEGK